MIGCILPRILDGRALQHKIGKSCRQAAVGRLIHYYRADGGARHHRAARCRCHAVLTRDSTARRGRDFANFIAQGLQRAHFDAMSLRVAHIALVCADGMDLYRTDQTNIVRSVFATPGVVILDAPTDGQCRQLPCWAPAAGAMARESSSTHGNAGISAAAANLHFLEDYIPSQPASHST